MFFKNFFTFLKIKNMKNFLLLLFFLHLIYTQNPFYIDYFNVESDVKDIISNVLIFLYIVN